MYSSVRRCAITGKRICPIYAQFPVVYVYKGITTTDLEQSIKLALFGPRRDGKIEPDITCTSVQKDFRTGSKKLWNKENKKLFGPLKSKKTIIRKVKTKTKSPTKINADIAMSLSSQKKGLIQDKAAGSLEHIWSIPLFNCTETDGDSCRLVLPEISPAYDPKALCDWYSPSVSTVLEKSRPPEQQILLDKWKERMIGELGEEGFQKYQQGKSLLPNLQI